MAYRLTPVGDRCSAPRVGRGPKKTHNSSIVKDQRLGNRGSTIAAPSHSRAWRQENGVGYHSVERNRPICEAWPGHNGPSTPVELQATLCCRTTRSVIAVFSSITTKREWPQRTHAPQLLLASVAKQDRIGKGEGAEASVGCATRFAWCLVAPSARVADFDIRRTS